MVIAALLTAPATGGTSVVAVTGLGFTTGTAGAAVNVTTDIADIIKTNKENSEIMIICRGRNNVAERLKKHFDELERVAIELKQLNVEETEAYALSLLNLVKKGNSVRTSASNIQRLSKCANLASGASNVLLRGGANFGKP
ncbi:unnamed protein product [Didymodactylos carnosus]|uniref:Uncharacterized protein n=1 Tax=Didymodactylos carnosus TaxID=1234261 RepID=A0A815HA63_9BILA|nr:unnamed protein product [Didymodactylos carnosus]CAF1529209.1 unnamed protein product [Didymodactylos carnosus]CAF4221443.1 unnamed protein product [Didymodactylos carnosus]CAF4315964.1 unnamed protein product [Didymodactylos carnosus]